MKPNKPLKLQSCYEATFSKTGALLVTVSRDVVAWNVEARSKRFRVHPVSHPSSSCIHPREEGIVVKNTSGEIVLLDAQHGALLRTLDDARDNEGSNVEYSSCGEFVIDGSWSGHLTVRSATTGQLSFQTVFPDEMITRIARCESGRNWFVVHQPRAEARGPASASAYISIWDWPLTQPRDYLLTGSDHIKAVAVSPDASRLCLLGDDVAVVMNLADKQIQASAPFKFGGTQWVVAWSPDGREIAVVERGGVAFYDADTLERRSAMELDWVRLHD